MRKAHLDQRRVAELTGYSVDMVKGWCTDPQSKRYRKMQDRALKTLRLALQAETGTRARQP
ncbi:MAG: hypothetical protein ACYDBH_02115 [Acidobacteriaceae bacterium]